MHAKQELEALKISKKEYSTNISEAQEYSNAKAERVSLPKRMLGSNQALFQTNKSKQTENKKNKTRQVKYIRCDRIKI